MLELENRLTKANTPMVANGKEEDGWYQGNGSVLWHLQGVPV